MSTTETFALGAVEATPDGGPVLAVAEALIEIGGALVLVPDAQIIERPGGRREVRVRAWHPPFGWIGPARLPEALGNAIAAEALASLNNGDRI